MNIILELARRAMLPLCLSLPWLNFACHKWTQLKFAFITMDQHPKKSSDWSTKFHKFTSVKSGSRITNLRVPQVTFFRCSLFLSLFIVANLHILEDTKFTFECQLTAYADYISPIIPGLVSSHYSAGQVVSFLCDMF